jgi:hypothetical protein
MARTLCGSGPHYGTSTIGYRHFRPSSGLMIRAGVTPCFNPSFKENAGVWPAFSVGWAR